MPRVRLVSPEILGATPEVSARPRFVPGHILLTGRDGIGRRTLARAFAAEYGAKYTEAASGALNQTGDLMGILTGMTPGDVLIVSDVGRLSKNISEFLTPALKEFAVDFVLDKGMYARTINVPLSRFTCIATAHAPAEVRPELLEVFHLHIPLAEYSQSELQTICERIAQTEGLSFTASTAALIAGISDGNPRRIQLLVRRIKATGRNSVSEQEAAEILHVLGFGAAEGASAGGPPALGQLSGVEFEHSIGRLLQGMGFRTEMTKATGDGGIDIVAVLDRPIIGGRYLIQCKRFAPEAPVSPATVREFYGTLIADRRAVKGILITTSGFTSQALAFAQHLPIELIGGQQLRQLLAQYGISIEIQSPPQALFE